MPLPTHASGSKFPDSTHLKVTRPKSTSAVPKGESRRVHSARERDDTRKECAKMAYDRLRSVGMPNEVEFDAFSAMYLGEAGGDEGGGGDLGKKQELEGGRSSRLPKKGTKGGSTQKAHKQDPDAGARVGAGDALERLSERLLGRAEVGRVRREIALARTRGLYENPVAKEETRRESLLRVLASVKTEWEVESGKMKELEARNKKLKIQADEMRKKLVMLGVLQRLGDVRVRRLGWAALEHGKGNWKYEEVNEVGSQGMGDLIDDLRKEVDSATKKIQGILKDRPKSIGASTSSGSLMVKANRSDVQRRPDLAYHYTRIALANLHAYHARLKRVYDARGVDDPASKDDLERRLETALKGIGVHDGTELQELKTKLVGLAQQRAARERQFRAGLVGGGNVSVDDLEGKQYMNEDKRKEVQQLMDRVVALGWVCEGYIDLMSTFRQETAPTLDKMLDTEQKRVEGHIDLTKAEVLNTQPPNDAPFAQQIREIASSTKLKVWEDVEDAFKRSSRLQSIRLVQSGEATPVVVPEHSQLVRRKAAKAEHGYGIADEVRRLLEGSKRVKYV